MKVIPAIETALLIVGFKTVELLKTAVSPGRSGTFAGVFQFAALFQLLVAGGLFHACWAWPGARISPHHAAIDEASTLAGLEAGEWRCVRFSFLGRLVGRFIKIFSGWWLG